MPQTKVRVRLQQDDKTHKVWLEVGVASLRLTGRWGILNVSADTNRTEYLVSCAAEAIAGFQNDVYGDTHNPPECAKQAVEGLKEIQALAAQAKKAR